MESNIVLLELLMALDGVQQDPRHHPEGDALYHSLQVFEHALANTDDPDLLAAALLHDVGKAVSLRDHAYVGAEALEGWVSGRTVWLVEHHMDLLHRPRRTRKRWRGRPELFDLERLRRWDVAGRSPFAVVRSPEEAVAIITSPLQCAYRAYSHEEYV